MFCLKNSWLAQPGSVYAAKICCTRRLTAQPARALQREKSGYEFGAVSRELEQRLVHQVQVQIAAAHVDDERHRRPDGGDIGEVLFGADAEIGAPGPRRRVSSGMTRCA